MKIEIKGKIYSFIWGLKCFANAEEILNLNADVILSNINSPKILSAVIYEGLNLWCDRNNEDRPFLDYEEFMFDYDTLGTEEVFKHIVTDLFESMYIGATVIKHLEKVFNVDNESHENAVKAKKKYLLALEKRLSTSQAGDSNVVKLKSQQSKSTKSTDTATS